jgi:nitroreductase/NAD-dependent dihydropyrimidine dehydrogenase PreA subunit
MGLLIVDESKCKKDGICAGECPMAIIRLQDGDGYPELVPGGDAACLTCGHCVAVCPHGALSHARVPIEECPSIKNELTINEEQAVQFLRSRRSIRSYEDKPVEQDKIQRLIEIGRYAPTGSNSQLVEWVVFTDKSRIHDLAALAVDWMRHALKQDPQATAMPYLPLIVAAWDAGYDAVLRNAPALVVATAPEKAGNGMVDLTLALSYLELAALTLGLGTCWAGLLQAGCLYWQPLKEALGIPEGYPHHYPIMLGYPKVKYHRLPARKAPKITWK